MAGRRHLAAFRERYKEVRPHWALVPVYGGDPVTPAGAYAGGIDVQIPEWEFSDKAAEEKIARLMKQDAQAAPDEESHKTIEISGPTELRAQARGVAPAPTTPFETWGGGRLVADIAPGVRVRGVGWVWALCSGDSRRVCGWCPGAELNHRHRDFQSRALPTELPGRMRSALRPPSFIRAGVGWSREAVLVGRFLGSGRGWGVCLRTMSVERPDRMPNLRCRASRIVKVRGRAHSLDGNSCRSGHELFYIRYIPIMGWARILLPGRIQMS